MIFTTNHSAGTSSKYSSNYTSDYHKIENEMKIRVCHGVLNKKYDILFSEVSECVKSASHVELSSGVVSSLQ